eukprot:CAMPEP_0172603498 /NCGR_PEP_ID=MMETSP1068-20121228/23749_1 /TAXON_ID=35684 /ORGANISM="Pseudopedinella elastica, Strain CCMP716" /LENGTH=225 /DNA_ID=CAMNT_0013405259 /DNA_START=235 /DNA_END=913 /DNA_ORIENTATION=+
MKRQMELGARQAELESKLKKEEARQAELDAAHEVEQDAAVARAKELGILPTPVTRARVSLRMYSHPQSVFRAHSFLVGNEQGGLSEQLGRVLIEADKTTLDALRQLIETVNDNNMIRRSPLYQEFLITVSNIPNPYKYGDKDLRHYRFAAFAQPGDLFPTLIPKEEEETMLVVDSVPNFLTDDLLLVPVSQVRPDGTFPEPEDLRSAGSQSPAAGGVPASKRARV